MSTSGIINMCFKRALFLVLILAAQSGLSAEPELILNRESFDFGLVPPKTVLDYRLVCVANGEDTLKIAQIKTGCGCITSSTDSLTILPGDSAEIGLSWDLRHLRGALAKTVYLFTDRSDDPYRFEITAYAGYADSSEKPIVTIQPQDVRLRPSDGGRVVSAIATVRNLTEKACAIKLVEQSEKSLTLSYPESLDPKATGKIRFALSQEEIGERFSSSATFEVTTADRVVRLTVPVAAGSSSGSVLTNNKK